MGECSEKSLSVWGFIDDGAVANGLVTCTGRKALETRPTKAMFTWGRALWKSLWVFERYIKVGHHYPPPKTPLPGLEDD